MCSMGMRKRNARYVADGRTGYTRRMRRTIASLAALVALVVIAPAASATADVQVSRIAGTDRYATAAKIATSRSVAPQIVLARGDLFPDALVAAGVAMQYNSPTVLLTETDRLPQATADALASFDARSGKGFIWILGDKTAISDAVAVGLERQGWSTVRIEGATRYETAARAALVNPEEPPSKAILVSGVDFADALAAGPMAYVELRVILLTPPGALHPATREALRATPDVVIVGGTSAVSPAVEGEVRAMGRTVTRIAGPNRQSTAIAVAERLRTNDAFPITTVRLARGDGFADALAAGADSGDRRIPIVFTESSERLGDTTRAWLTANAATITKVEILGGTEAVSAAAEGEARQAASGPTVPTP
jgi:putative cell wall-binding protein